MELPVAKESYEPSGEALIRAVKRAAAVYARTAAAEQTLDCGVAFCAARRGRAAALNFVSDFRPAAGQDVAAALAELDAHFAGAGGRCLALQSAQADWPAAWVQPVEAQGYRGQGRAVLLLRDYQPPRQPPAAVQIIPARASYGQLPDLLRRMSAELVGGEAAADVAAAQLDFLDEARLDLFLGRRDGQAVALAGVLSLGQMGVIYPAWTDPGHRRRGIGATLMHHVIEHCQRATFEQVLLDRPADDPAMSWCQRLGFRHAAGYVQYQRP